MLNLSWSVFYIKLIFHPKMKNMSNLYDCHGQPGLFSFHELFVCFSQLSVFLCAIFPLFICYHGFWLISCHLFVIEPSAPPRTVDQSAPPLLPHPLSSTWDRHHFGSTRFPRPIGSTLVSRRSTITSNFWALCCAPSFHTPTALLGSSIPQAPP